MNIFLSPHHDDICLSLFRTASRAGGELVNLFTTSSHVSAALDLPVAPADRIAAITRLRRQEDEAFAAGAGLKRHDLGLSETPVLGRYPFDLADLRENVAQLSGRLLPFLQNLLRSGVGAGPARIYCPMGIGGHRDHVLVLLAIAKAWPTFSGRCELLLYEDLPYASHAAIRQQGLKRAGEILAGRDLAPVMRGLTRSAVQAKLDALGAYASQFATPPDVKAITPASGFRGPHEIVWELAE